MDIDQANLNNLTGLWRKYGVQDITLGSQSDVIKISANQHWPHRVWQPAAILKTSLSDSNNLLGWLEQIPDVFTSQATLPVWPFDIQSTPLASGHNVSHLEQQLALKGWQCAFEQTAMYLPIADINTQLFSKRDNFSIEQVSTSKQLQTWLNIASEAFGYPIDQHVFEKLIHDPSIQILLAVLDGEAVATALLYQDDAVIGLHQMGVGKSFQGKGIAKGLMHGLIVQCQQQESEHLVLQASQAGKPLYDSLGFKGQFGVKNYRKSSFEL